MTGAISLSLRHRLTGSVAATALLVAASAQAQVATPANTGAANTLPANKPATTPAQAARTAPGGAPSTTSFVAGTSQSIIVRAQRRLLRETNSPSAVTELGTAQIAQTGVQGSPSTLLRAAPSVYVY